MAKPVVIIPTYNEIENISLISKAVLAQTPSDVHLLVVDDASPDGTGAAVLEIAKTEPRIHLLSRTKKEGLGRAYLHAFQHAFDMGFDQIIHMDADFSHDPKYLPGMLQALQQYDYVMGSRYVKGGGTKNWGIIRKIVSRCGSIYARMILWAPIRDYTGGFIGWNKKTLEAIQFASVQADGYSFLIEMKYRAWKLGYRFKELPIIFEDRRVGKSKMSSRIFLEALLLVPRLRCKV